MISDTRKGASGGQGAADPRPAKGHRRAVGAVRRTRWRGLLVLLATAALACAGSIWPVTANAANATDAPVRLYVAPAGTGSSCTVSQPCSLRAAQTKVRALTAGMT